MRLRKYLMAPLLIFAVLVAFDMPVRWMAISQASFASFALGLKLGLWLLSGKQHEEERGNEASKTVGDGGER